MFLSEAPAGLYIDEALPAAHALCLNQTGQDLTGETSGLFHAALKPGITSPPPFTYIQPLRLWISLFSATPESLRCFSALIGVFLILGAYLLSKRLFPGAELYALLLICISPWCFHFFRVAWEVVIFPTSAVWLVYFLTGQRKLDFIAAVITASIFYYSYPAARLLLPLFIFFCLIGNQFCNLGVTKTNLLGAAGALIAGLLLMPQNGDPALTRYAYLVEDLGIKLADLGYINGIFAFSFDVAVRFLSHFGPTFLLFRGDENLRHGSGYLGVLSWPESLALTLGLIILLWRFLDRRVGGLKDRSLYGSNENLGKIFLIVSLILISILPAALTAEGVPHALRSSAAWPFVSILAALITSKVWHNLWFRRLFLLSSLSFSTLFLYDYFWVYSELSRDSFDAARLERAQTLTLSEFLFLEQESEDLIKAYYTMTNYQDSCSDARARFELR